MSGVAVIGTGPVVQLVHLPAIARLGAPGPVAIAARDPERLRSLAEAEGLDSWWTDWRAMLSEVRPDVVIVATPDHLHAEMALEAIRGGAHVLVEKPAVLRLEDGRELLRAAGDARRLVAVNMTLRLLPATAALADMAARLRRPSFQVDYAVSPPAADRQRDADDDGLVRTIGVHAVDLVSHVAGDRVVSAQQRQSRPGEVQLALGLSRGAQGRCRLTYREGGLQARMAVQNGRLAELLLGPGNAWETRADGRTVGRGRLWADLVEYSAIEDLVVSVREGREPAASLEEHLRLLEALAEAHS